MSALAILALGANLAPSAFALDEGTIDPPPAATTTTTTSPQTGTQTGTTASPPPADPAPAPAPAATSPDPATAPAPAATTPDPAPAPAATSPNPAPAPGPLSPPAPPTAAAPASTTTAAPLAAPIEAPPSPAIDRVATQAPPSGSAATTSAPSPAAPAVATAPPVSTLAVGSKAKIPPAAPDHPAQRVARTPTAVDSTFGDLARSIASSAPASGAPNGHAQPAANKPPPPPPPEAEAHAAPIRTVWGGVLLPADGSSDSTSLGALAFFMALLPFAPSDGKGMVSVASQLAILVIGVTVAIFALFTSPLRDLRRRGPRGFATLALRPG